MQFLENIHNRLDFSGDLDHFLCSESFFIDIITNIGTIYPFYVLVKIWHLRLFHESTKLLSEVLSFYIFARYHRIALT